MLWAQQSNVLICSNLRVPSGRRHNSEERRRNTKESRERWECVSNIVKKAVRLYSGSDINLLHMFQRLFLKIIRSQVQRHIDLFQDSVAVYRLMERACDDDWRAGAKKVQVKCICGSSKSRLATGQNVTKYQPVVLNRIGCTKQFGKAGQYMSARPIEFEW